MDCVRYSAPGFLLEGKKRLKRQSGDQEMKRVYDGPFGGKSVCSQNVCEIGELLQGFISCIHTCNFREGGQRERGRMGA